MTGADDSRRTPRRATAPRERQVDADRTRAALLDAALEEFAAKGYAGARVRDIAARAGVSKDLIAYHFGGKDGLYLAVQRAWLDRRAGFTEPGRPLAETIADYLHDALRDPRPMRLLAWRGLATGGPPPPDASAPDDHPGVDSMRRRQDAGEIGADLDPATVQLALLGAVAAPVVFGGLARGLFGAAPGDPAFERRYRTGLQQLLAALAPHPDQDTAEASRTITDDASA